MAGLDREERSNRAAALRQTHTVPNGTYQVSSLNIEITPDLDGDSPWPLQGYAAFGRSARQKITPLLLQAVLLQDQSYNKLLIVSADIFGFGRKMVDRIRQKTRIWGIPPENIILNASHTHYAPGTVERVAPVLGTFQPNYAASVCSAVFKLLPHLHKTLEPCLVYVGSARAQIGENRRRASNGTIEMAPNPDGYYHKSTPFLVFDRFRSSTSTVVINHGCHPTGLGGARVIAADYPAFIKKHLLERKDIDNCVFLQGAAGSARQYTDPATGRADIASHGRHIAEQVQQMLDGQLQPVRDGLSTALETVDLPLQPLPTTQEFVEAYREIPGDTKDAFQTMHRQWAKKFACMPAEDRPQFHRMEVQFVGLGRAAAIVSLPAEPVGELARNLLARTDLPSTTMFLGYTNGLSAYLPTRTMTAEGGYEVDDAPAVYGQPAPFAPSAEDVLITTIRQQIDTWHAQANHASAPHLRKDRGAAFFALSTGRCGTKTLARILQTADNADVYHHPRPFLVEETLQAYHGQLDTTDTFWRARAGVIKAAWDQERIFGELDHNMTPFVPVIASEIPEAQFLVLIRNPWDFVRSAMRRHYYRGHVWDHGRLCPEPGHEDAERWNTMSCFEKTCWLWNETYERIRQYVAPLPADRYRVVHFRALVDGPECAERLFDFLNLRGFRRERVRAILDHKLNKQRTGTFPRPAEWSADQHRVLWRECQHMIHTFDLEHPSDYAPHEERQEADARRG